MKKTQNQEFFRKWQFREPRPWKAQNRVKLGSWPANPIQVPSHIIAFVRLCQANPSFFSTNINPSTDYFTQLYYTLIDLESSAVGETTHDTQIRAIRSRIIKIAFHDLKERLEGSNPRPQPNSEFVRRLLAIEKNAVERAKAWARAGGRYRALSAELGGPGSMICVDISNAK
jgi:hypothetical protein